MAIERNDFEANRIEQALVLSWDDHMQDYEESLRLVKSGQPGEVAFLTVRDRGKSVLMHMDKSEAEALGNALLKLAKERG